MVLVPPPKPPDPETKDWSDHSDRFAVDTLLRVYGFKIARRKAGSEPLWSKSGVLFWQSEAVQRITKKELKQAIMNQERYQQRKLEEAERDSGIHHHSDEPFPPPDETDMEYVVRIDETNEKCIFPDKCIQRLCKIIKDMKLEK